MSACASCGVSLREGARFCSSCGALVADPTITKGAVPTSADEHAATSTSESDGRSEIAPSTLDTVPPPAHATATGKLPPLPEPAGTPAVVAPPTGTKGFPVWLLAIPGALLIAVVVVVLVMRSGSDSSDARSADAPPTTVDSPARATVPLPSTVTATVVGLDFQEGQPVTVAVDADRISGITRVELLANGAVVADSAMVGDLAWTPTEAGTYSLQATVWLDDGSSIDSAVQRVDVGSRRLGDPSVPPDVVALANQLAEAHYTHNWPRIRELDTTEVNTSDERFQSLDGYGYSYLQRETFIPVRWQDRGDGSGSLRGGLVADEGFRTRFYCVTWDVNVGLGTVSTPAGAGVSTLVRDDTGSVPPENYESESLTTC